MQETLDILSDDEALADLRQSREDFAAGDTFDADHLPHRRGQAHRGNPLRPAPTGLLPDLTQRNRMARRSGSDPHSR
jgi:hypothetical protein